VRIPIFQVNSFATGGADGNPAAVCLLPRWLSDPVLADVAWQNNLSETAFLVAQPSGYALRWFTPSVEVDLCGHATLAAGHVVFRHLAPGSPEVVFHTRSGALTVRPAGDRLAMDFPALVPRACPAPAGLAAALGVVPREVFFADDYFAVLDSEQAVRQCTPDIARIAGFREARGVCITAPGTDCDFVSRFFALQSGVAEDPVTGSTHCALAPFWAARLGRNALRARQVSARGGAIDCEVRGDRVLLTGAVVPYLEGHVEVRDE